MRYSIDKSQSTDYAHYVIPAEVMNCAHSRDLYNALFYFSNGHFSPDTNITPLNGHFSLFSFFFFFLPSAFSLCKLLLFSHPQTQEAMIIERIITVEYLDPSMSQNLISKFPDASAFGFNFSESSIWSPLLPRGRSGSETFRSSEKLLKTTAKSMKRRRKKRAMNVVSKRLDFSPDPTPKRVSVFLAHSSLSRLRFLTLRLRFSGHFLFVGMEKVLEGSIEAI